jgi:putative transposase
MEEFNRRRHSVSRLIVHLVFVTKYRRKVLDTRALDWLQFFFAQKCNELDCVLRAADGEADHFHLLVEYPPSLSVADLVNRLKGASSRELRQSRPDLANKYWKGVLWTPSYFAVSAGGAPLTVIKRYVDQQRAAPHSSPPFRAGFPAGDSDD